eukprot:10048114-Ditylum_brightwellii.AAC.1
MAKAHSYIANHIPEPKQYKTCYREAVAFLASQDANQNKFPHIKCKCCQQIGHSPVSAML